MIAVTADEGESFRLNPAEIECFPIPKYQWKTVTDIRTNSDPRNVVPNSRIALDADGMCSVLFPNKRHAL